MMKKIIIPVIIGIFTILFVTEMTFNNFFNTSLFTGNISSQFETYGKVGEITRLPKGASSQETLFAEFIPRVIRLSIMVFGTVMLLMLVIAGIYLVAGGTDESLIQEAKKIFYYSIIGAVIVSISFGLVYGLTQINWTGL